MATECFNWAALSALAECATAALTAGLVYIAYGAAGTWRDQIREDRKRDCLGAFSYCGALLGRTTPINGGPNRIQNNEAVWAGWRDCIRFLGSIGRPVADPDVAGIRAEGQRILVEMNNGAGVELNAAFNALIERVEKLF